MSEDPPLEAPPGISAGDLLTGLGAQVEPASFVPVERDELDAADELPPVVTRYLMSHERQVIAVRKHPILLVMPAAVLLGGLAAAIWVNAWLYVTGRDLATTVRLVWLLFAFGALWAVVKYLSWRVTWFVVTGVRIMVITGLFRRSVTPLPLKRIRDLELQQSVTGRLFGYGTLECESIATDHALHTINYVPFTVEMWSAIWLKLLPPTGNPGMSFGGMQDDPW